MKSSSLDQHVLPVQQASFFEANEKFIGNICLAKIFAQHFVQLVKKKKSYTKSFYCGTILIYVEIYINDY